MSLTTVPISRKKRLNPVMSVVPRLCGVFLLRLLSQLHSLPPVPTVTTALHPGMIAPIWLTHSNPGQPRRNALYE